ncbi:hypothetical protein [Ralstonia phage RP31]|uniref:Uncharacterized protein n=2 Tax=Ripduovirus RP12 TaxID=2560700 RepID=A0A1L7N0U5_9CAUD|nr:hypothetical protein FDH28_gp114 [Ralstonia phage RP12]BAW19088.1 hypothetical protein [Ralstonia phage RP12]BAW19374.1 hypothetical protein [Ralstonia phage RP31]
MISNVISLAAEAAKQQVAKYLTNKCVYLDGASHGKEVLHSILTELQKRIDATNTSEVAMESAIMRYAMADAIELAYNDFPTFSEQWECKVWYRDHPEKSNIFVFYFAEKNGNRQLHFRFAGLKND